MTVTEYVAQQVIASVPLLKRAYRVLCGAKRYAYLSEYITKYKCRRILEIGVWDGDHAHDMILAAKKIHSTAVEYYGFDLFEDLTRVIHSSEVAKKPPSLQMVLKKLQKTRCHIHLVKGDSTVTLPRHVSSLQAMDFIFIDGGHSLATIESDWKYCSQLMKDHTIVIFDDYWNRIDAGCKPLIDSLDRTKFIVELLPQKDVFKKKDGLLTINFALVKKRSAP